MASERDPRVTPQAVERLTVLWVVCTVLVLLVLIILTLVARGKLRQQAEVIARQTLAIELLESRVTELEREVRIAATAPAAALRPPPPDRPTPVAPRPLTPQATNQTASPAPAPRLSEAELQRRLAALLVPTPDGPALSDPNAAGPLLAAVEADDPADRAPEHWAQLAIVAYRLGRPGQAETFAQLARQGGAVPTGYYELLVRQQLARRAPEALPVAERLAAAPDAPPATGVLLAAARMADGQADRAGAALRPLPPLTRLSSADRLLLARVLAELGRWDELARVLDGWRAPDPGAQREVNRYRAYVAIERGEQAAGLAILDHLLTSQPDDPDLRIWRARALLKAGQHEAARAALDHPALDEDRAETWYWRGMLEAATGADQAAIEALQAAVRRDERYAPAWEALGSLMLNADRLDEAARLLRNAVAADPQRASAHLLLALTHARGGDRAQTLGALRRALALDPSLAETAKATVALTALIAPDEIDALASRAE